MCVLSIKCSRTFSYIYKSSRLKFMSTASLNTTIFNWEDPLNFDKLIHDDERAVRNSVQTYCREKLLPRIVGPNKNAVFDRKIFNEMGELGILGCNIKGYDCPGVSSIIYGLICREVESVDSSYRIVISSQDLAMGCINLYGSTEQKEKYLPRMAKGEVVGCVALTEPNFGSDAGGLESTAIYNAKTNTYKITGKKTWIANSSVADIFIVWAKNVDGKLAGFIIEREKIKEGFITSEIEGNFYLKALPIGNIILDEVVVPGECLLPYAVSLRGPFQSLDNTRYGISWGTLGSAESCFRIARQYALDRTQFGKPLASYQLIQKKLADMITEIALGYQVCIHVGRLKDQNLMTSEMISILKRNNCAKALCIARTARDILGGNGISEEYHVIRHMVNLESATTYEGTHDIHSLILGKAITGIQAFR